MYIQELILHTRHIGDQKAFYCTILSLPLLTETTDSFTVQAGRTRLCFEESESDVPPYHIAFTIPRQTFYEAKSWVQQRVPLLHKNGEDEIFFAHLNARSFYFCDPAGNILEDIVHYNLNTKRVPANMASVLHVSEIGLPVADVPAVADRLDKQCALQPYGGINLRTVRFPG
jgi:catechol-2,3-dioxygenase